MRPVPELVAKMLGGMMSLQEFAAEIDRLSDPVRIVNRQLRSANARADELTEMALLSGAMPGEFSLTWRFYHKHGGVWPTL